MAEKETPEIDPRTCEKCGVLVGDKSVHDRVHRKQEEREREAMDAAMQLRGLHF